MKLGVNYSVSGTLPIIEQLADEGTIDYCEVLIDNFIHLPSAELSRLARRLKIPIAFHIMQSRFLERSQTELIAIGAQIRRCADILAPGYCSDHLARFTYRGRDLYHLAELDYRNCLEVTIERVQWWQRCLGQTLYLENFPSIMDGAEYAPGFHAALGAASGAGLLFDISNAVCAQRNTGSAADAWLPQARATRHFHVGGYSASMRAPSITVDTHAAALADDTLRWIRRLTDTLNRPDATLTFERDGEIDIASIRSELVRLRMLLAQPAMPHERMSDTSIPHEPIPHDAIPHGARPHDGGPRGPSSREPALP